jgi:hypothetical protein
MLLIGRCGDRTEIFKKFIGWNTEKEHPLKALPSFIQDGALNQSLFRLINSLDQLSIPIAGNTALPQLEQPLVSRLIEDRWLYKETFAAQHYHSIIANYDVKLKPLDDEAVCS